MRLPFNFSFFFRHKRIYLSAIFVFFAAAALLSSRISLRQDITEMLPRVLKEEMLLFQSSPLSGKIFVLVQSPQRQQARLAADFISRSLTRDSGAGLYGAKTDEEFFLSYYYGAAKLWNPSFASAAQKLIEPEALEMKMEENHKALLSLAGAFTRDLILADPVGLADIFAGELKSLNINGAFEIKDGYISSQDGKRILLVFDCRSNQMDSSAAKKIGSAFDNIVKELPYHAQAFMMGAARYTNENNDIIAKDIKRVLIVSCALMTVVFLVFLRRAKALLIYLVPPAAMSFAAVAASFFFNGLSAVTIGFGSVLMGLSVDYCLYMYFAMKASKEQNRAINAKKMVKPVLASALTSIAAFSVLSFSSIPLFGQISLFSAAGLLAALFLALCAAPFIFACEESPEKTLGKMKPLLSFPAAAVIIILFFAAAAASLKYVKFNASLDSLNTVSKRFEADRLEFEKFTGNAYNNNALFFVFGKTPEEALQNNEEISALNKDILKLAALYPSARKAESNLAAWKTFWNGERVAAVEKKINAFSKEKGLKPEIFAPFIRFLKTGESLRGQKFSLTELYNPVIKHNDGFAFVNIVPENAVINVKEGIKTVFISNAALREKIVSNISGDIVKMMLIMAGCVFPVLIFWLKKVQFAAAAVLPALCGICGFLVFSALSGIEVNLFGLLAAPLLIGLGIDYGIFIVYQQKGDTELHPTKAVIVAALSTMIGFGSLMAARHKVLFMIGFMVFTGISTAMAVSVFIIAPLLKKADKKMLAVLVFFLLPFAGCAAGVKYNVAEPPLSKEHSGTSVFYGSYKDELHFRAIARKEDGGYRIVIMSDLGVKMQDMKIKQEQDTDIYFHMQHMPKEAVEDFAGFFKEYYFEENKNNIKQNDMTVYYFRHKKPVLWARKI